MKTDAKITFGSTFLCIHLVNTNPDFQHHGIDDATDNSDEVEHIPSIFEEILRITEAMDKIEKKSD